MEEKYPFGRVTLGMSCFLGWSLGMTYGAEFVEDTMGAAWASLFSPLFLLSLPFGFWGFAWMVGGRAHANNAIRFAIRSFRDFPFAMLWFVRRVRFGADVANDESHWLNQRLERSMREERESERREYEKEKGG